MTPSDLLCDLISIPSVNPMGCDVQGEIYLEKRLSDWLVDFFRQIGAPCERIEVAPNRANVLARYEAPGAQRTLLMDVHQDTVPVEGMTIDPFHPARTQGRITGRGACDVKGGMAAMLFAFQRLCRQHPTNSSNVVVSCTCDEEATVLGITDLVTYWQNRQGTSRLLSSRPDGAIVAEPTELNAVVAHRGVLRLRAHTHGRACHSSDPTQGKNAIYAMAPVLVALEQLASQLETQTLPHALCGRASLSVGRITGGMSVNIVPPHCAIEIDRRLVPGESPGQALEQLHQAMAQVDPGVTCDDPWICCPAMDDSVNQPLADRLLEHVRSVAGPRKKIGVPYCTHASAIHAAGVPAMVFGPGSIAQAHTQDEYIEVESLEQAAEVYYRFCCDDAAW